jgi:hypothetical protein
MQRTCAGALNRVPRSPGDYSCLSKALNKSMSSGAVSPYDGLENNYSA